MTGSGSSTMAPQMLMRREVERGGACHDCLPAVDRAIIRTAVGVRPHPRPGSTTIRRPRRTAIRPAYGGNMQLKSPPHLGWAAIVLATSIAGCMAPVGSSLRVPSDARDTCRRLCAGIGLQMSAVAIMASNVGCVCQEHRQGSQSAADREAVTAGMATILLEEEEQRRH